MQKVIDVSDLEPPEPMNRILDELMDMGRGDWLRVHHSREPFPLYNMLKSMGYCWLTTRGKMVAFEIIIWPEDESPPPGVNIC
jgi:hypothetical protein